MTCSSFDMASWVGYTSVHVEVHALKIGKIYAKKV